MSPATGSPTGSTSGKPNIVQAGPGLVKITIGWDTGDYYAGYYGRVYIEGPSGTPHTAYYRP